MERCCTDDVSTAEKILNKVRERGLSNESMDQSYNIQCKSCNTIFTMETFEASCKLCSTIAVVAPCHADDPANIQFIKA